MVNRVVIGPLMALPPGETARNIAQLRAREEVDFTRYVPRANIAHASTRMHQISLRLVLLGVCLTTS